MERFVSVPLLIIDDLGMRKLPMTAAEDLLEIVMRRYERASTLLTSNRRWTTGAGPLPLLAALGIGAVLSWVIKRYSAEEAVAHPLAFAAYVGWSLVSSLFLTPLALCTMDSADWGTRTLEQQEVPVGSADR